MTIAAIETLRLEAFPNLLWVLVEDGQGTRGLGETFFGAQAAEAYIHESAAPKLIGQDAVGVEPARRLLQPYVGFQAAGAELRGNSALDIALWDLWGKRSGQPVWRLLGGRSREAIRTYNTCAGSRYVRSAAGQTSANWGTEAQDGHEDLAAFLSDAGALAESLMEQGITGMKIWPFDRYAEASNGMAITPAQLTEGCEPLRKIRAAVGESMQIMLELHGLWSLPAAAEIARACEPYDLYWIEDPIPANPPAALADFRRKVRCRVTGSETLAGRQQFRALMEGPGGRRGDAGPLLVRRPDRSQGHRQPGRGLAPAHRAPRLHRAGRLRSLLPPLGSRAQRPDPGKRARLLRRLVPRAGDRPATAGRRPSAAARGSRIGHGAQAGNIRARRPDPAPLRRVTTVSRD